MSSMTSEWQLKTKDNCIKYIIDIDNFDKKVKNFRAGRDIYSKIFKIASSTFQISIYPIGSESEHRNHVGVFLRNKSSWRVRAAAKFSIENTNVSYYLKKDFFDKEGGIWGCNKFISHNRCVRNDLLSEEGDLTLQVDVELVEEEIPIYRDLSKTDTMKKLENLEDVLEDQKEEIKDKLGNLEDVIEDQKEEIKDQKAMISNLELKVDRLQVSNKLELLELKDSIKELTTSHRLTAAAQSSNLPMVECPVCLEVVRKPMRLKQCGQGHIICDICHGKAATAQCKSAGIGNLNLSLCHVCKGAITGRPSTLESVLGLF